LSAPEFVQTPADATVSAASSKLSTLWLAEGARRLLQSFAGISIFDFPGLYLVRSFTLGLFVNLSKGVLIGKQCYFIIPHGLPVRQFSIGPKTKINHRVEIDYSGGVTIGARVWISQNVLIETHEHQIATGDKEDWKIRLGHLEIADGAWLGANCIILPSVRRIGKNAIVGAGAVVTQDVGDHVIVAGVPAKPIGSVPRDPA
jgi:acetyltransferase-like isoleucine patch superfamily enzyme